MPPLSRSFGGFLEWLVSPSLVGLSFINHLAIGVTIHLWQPPILHRFCGESPAWRPTGPTGSDLAADKAGWTIARKLLHVVWTVWTTIWLFNSLPWQITIFKFGKPSISMGHLYHGYVSHNQRVQKFMRKRKQSKHLVQDLALCPAPTPASARMKHRGVIPAMFPNEVGWIRILLANFRYFRCPTQICV